MSKIQSRSANLPFVVEVEYQKTFEEMVAAGKYDLANWDVNIDHFPITGQGSEQVRVTVMHLDHDRFFTDMILAEMEVLNRRPARIEELLAFGEKYPDIQRQFSIVAVGAATWINNRRGFPCLSGDQSARYLGLAIPGPNGEWYRSENRRFLAAIEKAERASLPRSTVHHI